MCRPPSSSPVVAEVVARPRKGALSADQGAEKQELKESNWDDKLGVSFREAALRRTSPGPRQFVQSALYVALVAASLFMHHRLFASSPAGGVVMHTVAGITAGMAFGDWGTGALHQLLDHPDCRAWPAPWGIIATDLQLHHHYPTLVCNGHWLIQLNWTMIVGMLYTAASLVIAPQSAFTLVFTLAAGCAITMATLAHRWAHMPPSQLPVWCAQLQRFGVLVGRQAHKRHHSGAHDVNFCLLTGWCNPLFNVMVPFWGPTKQKKAPAIALLAVTMAAPILLLLA